jgi:hypothetical protein
MGKSSSAPSSSSSGPAPNNASGRRPVDEVRNRNIRAAIWQNETEKGVMYNVTFSRSWRDDKAAWHDSDSFGYGDLMNLAKAAMDAHTAITAAVNKDHRHHRLPGERRHDRARPGHRRPRVATDDEAVRPDE